MNEKHPLDIISLIFGVLFLGLSIPVLLLDTPLSINAAWALPATVIVVGLLILGSALMPRRAPAAETEDRSNQAF